MCRSSLLVRIALLTVSLLLACTCGGGSSPTATLFLPCCHADGPFCLCFDDTGGWDPPVDWIQEVALATLDTEESCFEDGGKPYYQMRLGRNSVGSAQSLACALDSSTGFIVLAWFLREAWCSEAISYWHREAEIPYATGYRNSTWLFDWQLTNTTDIRTFYETEEASAGRGRWVDWSDLDYANFVAGVNGPVPGAYVLIRKYDAVDGFDGESHSMMVDEMTVYRQLGGVHRIELTILEGNSGDKVKNTRVIHDVLDVTPWGTQDIDSAGRRIRGFGVDLDAAGDPVYDPARLHLVNTTDPVPMPGPPPDVSDLEWEQYYAPKIPEFVAFIRDVGPGPHVESSVPGLAFSGIPDGRSVKWTIPADVDRLAPQGFDIHVDLKSEYPLPVEALLLRWGGEGLPQGYAVQWAGADERYEDADVPDVTEREVPLGADGLAALAIPVPLGPLALGATVRHLRFVFPPGTITKRAVLDELRFQCDWGPSQDAQDP